MAKRAENIMRRARRAEAAAHDAARTWADSDGPGARVARAIAGEASRAALYASADVGAGDDDAAANHADDATEWARIARAAAE